MEPIDKLTAYFHTMYEPVEFTGSKDDGLYEAEVIEDLVVYLALIDNKGIELSSFLLLESEMVIVPYVDERHYICTDRKVMVKRKYDHQLLSASKNGKTCYKFVFKGKVFDVMPGEWLFYNAFVRKLSIDQILADMNENNQEDNG